MQHERDVGLTLEEDLEDSTGLLVDESRDTLDTSTTGQSPNCRLGDTLDVVTKLCADDTSVIESWREGEGEGGWEWGWGRERTIFL
jgi:hypothetical protein